MSLIKKIKPYIQQFFERGDIFLLCICIICALYGTVMVYKTAVGMVSTGTTDINPTKLVIVQLFSMFLGIVAFVILTFLDGDLLGEQWKLLVVVQGFLLLLHDGATGHVVYQREYASHNDCHKCEHKHHVGQ